MYAPPAFRHHISSLLTDFSPARSVRGGGISAGFGAFPGRRSVSSGFDVGHLREDAFEAQVAPAARSFTKVVERLERGHLLTHRGTDDFIDRDALPPSQVTKLAMKGFRKAEAKGTHDNTPRRPRN
jgi:hypothetical protein